LIVTELNTLTKKRLLLLAGAFYGKDFILPSLLLLNVVIPNLVLPNVEAFSVAKGNR